MLRNKNLFLLFIIFLSFTLVPVDIIFAKVSIVEVMYDAKGTDTDMEWVKIINDNESDVDISKIKLTINDSNHLIKDPASSTVISKGDSVVIVDNPVNFKINYPDYTGKLFDSSFSLTNASGTVAIKDDKNTIIDLMSYDSSMGASGDGNSLQKINGVWIAAVPTIHLPEDNGSNSNTDNTSDQHNSTSTSDSGTLNQNNQTTKIVTRIVYISTHSSEEDLSDYNEKAVFDISAGRERLASVGSPIEFNGKYVVFQNNQCSAPSFKWSFGDGFETIGQNVKHIYKYSGEYQVVLNGTCGNYSSISRAIVKVISPNISFSNLTNGDVQITNNGKTEINIGGWKITGGQKDFIFPQDTIITAGKEIVLSKEDLNSGSLVEKLSLNNPLGREVLFINVKTPVQAPVINSQPIVDQKTASTTEQENVSNISVIEAEKLLAKYKVPLALKGQEIDKLKKVKNINVINIADKNLPINQNKENIVQTASVMEAVNSSSTKSFWSKLIGIPVNGMKSFAHIFYDF